MLKSYAAWLHLSLFCLGLPAVCFAWLGWQLSVESVYRVERGRIASDIYTALTDFDLHKSRLRVWSYKQGRSDDTPSADRADERLNLLNRMQQQASAIAANTRLAVVLDEAHGKSLQEHQDREALLLLLTAVIAKLTDETALRLDNDPSEFATIGAQFDRIGDVSLVEALAAARRQEAMLLAQERARADASLSAARRLFLTAGAFVSIVTLVLAVALSRRLRTPLRKLGAGVQAYRQGDFSYRLADFRDAEFSDLARQLNTMAGEVAQARAQATAQRQHLENMVAARTMELRTALDDLSATDAARKHLLVNIGHELRTPVTVLLGEAQVALRAKGQDGLFYRATLERIVTVARQMGSLTEDMISVVRNPAAPVTLSLRQTPLTDVIARATDTAKGLGASRQVRTRLDRTIPQIDVSTDPDRLHQVLVCLLDNAIRYSHDGGCVTLSCDLMADDHVMIQVKDEGIGIDNIDLPAIWDRGWRAQAARSHRPEGLGLGLAIAQQSARALGAALTIDSAGRAQGTNAVLRLPRCHQEA